MDTTTRTIAKSATWQIAGFFTMTLIGFLFTNSITAGGGIAVAGSVTGFLSYFLHEMAWSRINWGRKPA
ncbi:MAG: DUF2061 domain-containing protein [Pseudomonadota bacterium]